MSKAETIGVVGASGSLGGKLTMQACLSFENVYAFDITDGNLADTGVDPSLSVATITNKPSQAAIIDDVLSNCDVIHWAAPIDTVRTIPWLPKPALLVLHDSVMNNSVEAAHELAKKEEIVGRVAVAHCLMNKEGTVVIARDIGESERLAKHITDLGLNPELMTADEHDNIMAHSQSLWAVICKLLRPELEKYKDRKLLTPSAERFLAAMLDNESYWTDASYEAIVSNPKLESVAESVHEKVRNGQHR